MTAPDRDTADEWTLTAVLAWVRSREVHHLAAGAFAVVATVAAAISYDHVHKLAGPVWWAWLLPLSIDGLLVAGSLALWIERGAGGQGSPLSWASVVLGLVWSLGANLASTNPDWIPPSVVGPLIAVWPPIALGLAFELLIRVRRTGADPDRSADDEPAADQAEDTDTEPEPSTAPDRPDRPQGLTRAAEASLIDHLAATARTGQPLPSSNSLIRDHGIGRGRADRILTQAATRSGWTGPRAVQS